MDRMAQLKNYSQLKSKAVKLRKQGYSYNEINNEINVAKSTLSIWLKNIPLSSGQKERLYTKQIVNLSIGKNSQKERRKREITELIKKAEKEISNPLSFDTYRFIGAALYWAEGAKTKHFAITNSDPHLIVFMVKWFEKILNIPPQRLKVHLNIYPQQNEEEIKQFWSRLTGIPFENFGKSFIKPVNKGFKKNNLYYGTIKIRVSRGTDMRHQVFGWIKAMLKDINPEVELVQREWKFLKETPRPVNLRK